MNLPHSLSAFASTTHGPKLWFEQFDPPCYWIPTVVLGPCCDSLRHFRVNQAQIASVATKNAQLTMTIISCLDLPHAYWSLPKQRGITFTIKSSNAGNVATQKIACRIAKEVTTPRKQPTITRGSTYAVRIDKASANNAATTGRRIPAMPVNVAISAKSKHHRLT
jgi:hypothetical protein